MDLQLGLALPSNNASDPQDLFTSLTWNHSDTPSNVHHKKRSFSQLFDHNRDVLFPTLPLLPLTPTQQDDEDDLEDRHSSCSVITKNDHGDDGEAVVGWPPIISQRKKLRCDGDEKVPMRGSNAVYVKVTMAGEGIGRKVDLSLHHSFQKLKETLIAMFGKCQQHSNCYELAYQDKEGDWLLAEDLPWKDFVDCARRLKLLRSSM